MKTTPEDAMDTNRPLYAVGDRLVIAGREALVIGFYKDWPTILKYRHVGDDTEHLIISHFHDGPNRHIQRVQAEGR